MFIGRFLEASTKTFEVCGWSEAAVLWRSRPDDAWEPGKKAVTLGKRDAFRTRATVTATTRGFPGVGDPLCIEFLASSSQLTLTLCVHKYEGVY